VLTRHTLSTYTIRISLMPRIRGLYACREAPCSCTPWFFLGFLGFFFGGRQRGHHSRAPREQAEKGGRFDIHAIDTSATRVKTQVQFKNGILGDRRWRKGSHMWATAVTCNYTERHASSRAVTEDQIRQHGEDDADRSHERPHRAQHRAK
jgi:hypothetical protein